MFAKNSLANANLLCTRYCAKRYLHRQLLSRMFPFGGTSVAASATESVSNKASVLYNSTVIY